MSTPTDVVRADEPPVTALEPTVALPGLWKTPVLFGVFAVQMKLVSTSQVMAAAGAWAADPSKDLPDRMVDEPGMDAAHRQLIDGLVSKAVEEHGGMLRPHWRHSAAHPKSRKPSSAASPFHRKVSSRPPSWANP